MPTPKNRLLVSSMVGRSATPSSSNRTFSLSQGTKNRLTTNPGESAEWIAVLPVASAKAHDFSTVAAEVCAPGMTSSRRFCAGWKK
jgi:hypothetical protein